MINKAGYNTSCRKASRDIDFNLETNNNVFLVNLGCVRVCNICLYCALRKHAIFAVNVYSSFYANAARVALDYSEQIRM